MPPNLHVHEDHLWAEHLVSVGSSDWGVSRCAAPASTLAWQVAPIAHQPLAHHRSSVAIKTSLLIVFGMTRGIASSS